MLVGSCLDPKLVFELLLCCSERVSKVEVPHKIQDIAWGTPSTEDGPFWESCILVVLDQLFFRIILLTVLDDGIFNLFDLPLSFLARLCLSHR